MIFCPACQCGHRVFIKAVPGSSYPVWGFNGDMERPTITPSILVSYGESAPPDRPRICHSFVTNGTISYCGDSTHSLAGQSVPLPDF